MSVKARLLRLEVKASTREAPLYVTTLMGWLASLLSVALDGRPRPLSKKLARRISAAMAAPDDPLEADP